MSTITFLGFLNLVLGFFNFGLAIYGTSKVARIFNLFAGALGLTVGLLILSK